MHPQAAMGYSASFNGIAPGYPAWSDGSIVTNPATSGMMTSQDENNLNISEGTYSNVFYCFFSHGKTHSIVHPHCDLSFFRCWKKEVSWNYC